MMVDRRSGALYRQIDDLFGRGTVAGLDEGRLLERFVAEADAAAFEALVARFGPMVLGVCRRLLDDPNDVDDAFQATFLVLVRKAPTIRDGNLLGNWLYGVAYRVATRARANARRRRRTEGAGEGAGLEGEAMARSHRLEADWFDLKRVLDEEVNRLPEKYRAPVCLCYLQDQSYEEAAKRLKWPIGTVRSRLAKARELMRGRLVRRGVVLPAGVLAAALQPEVTRAAVSAALVERTLTSTLRGGAGGVVAAGGGSAVVARLAEEVITSMVFAKFKWIAGLALLAGMAGTSALMLAWSPGGNEAPKAATAKQSPASTAKQEQGPGRGDGVLGARKADAAGRMQGSAEVARGPLEATTAVASDPARANRPDTSSVVRRFVAQLRKNPAKLSAAAERIGLHLIDLAEGDVTLIAEEPEAGLTHCGSAWWSSDGGRILFDATYKNRFNETHLQSIALADGRLIRNDLGRGNCPSLSPDGRRIVFLLNSGALPGAAFGFWLMNSDGSARRHLGGYGRVKWGPDGDQLLVVAFSPPPEPTTLALMDVASAEQQPLTIPGHQVFSVPSWAGAGRIVAAIGTGDLADRVALLDVSDPDAVTVETVLWQQKDATDISPEYPVYEPKTGRCVFVGKRGEESALFTVQRGRPGSARRLEAEGVAKTLTDLAISPDGDYVVFCGDWRRAAGR